MFGWRKRREKSANTSADTPAVEDMRCSFCKKPKEDVRKLIAGPTVFICDECVDICADIIANDERLAAQSESSLPTSPPVARPPSEGEVSCWLCGEPALLQTMLAVENRGLLCDDCANAVEDALNRRRPAS